MSKQRISRRQFLKGTAAGALSVAAVGILGKIDANEDAAAVVPAAQADASTDTAQTATAAQTETTASETTASWRIAPDAIPQDQIKEVYVSDVLIIGAGNAGMAAGMSAIQNGASVTIVERLSSVGSSRSSFAALNSRLQQEAGVEINKHEIVEELCKYASHRVDQRLIRLWADESGATMDWLEDLMKEQGYEMLIETDCGNEDHGFYKTFPICHNLQATYEGDEPVPYMQDSSVHPEIAMHLVEPFQNAGGQILFSTPMQQLIQNEDGRVIGAVCKDADGDYIQVYGSKGVMICTGGYAQNEEMMRDMNPYAVKHCTTMEGYPGNVGDGIKAATWIGADKDDVATVMVFDRGGVPAGVGGGGLYENSGVMTHIGSQPFLKVNHDGERFCNESVPYDFIYHAAAKEKMSTYCMIFDSNWREQTRQFHTIGCSRLQLSPSGSKYILSSEDFTEYFFQNVLMPAGIVVEADTLEELSEKLQLPQEQFLATVARYNELCEKGEDEDFGKESYRMLPINQPPYRGVTLGGQLLCTLDGLRINQKMQVLNASGEVIEGLYAGGNDSGGFFSSNYPELMVGIAMGRTFTFARLAGENMAAAEAVKLDVEEFRKEKKEIVGGDGNGTYSSTKQGIGGDVTVTCTFEDGKLTDATIVGDGETEGYGKDAIPVLLENLLSSGSPEIDAVSGATITSTAVIEAAKECFAMAGVTY
jgi:uncharacterized protein with FMN-binding domain